MALGQKFSWLARTALDRILRALPTTRLQPPTETHEPGWSGHGAARQGNFPGSHIARRAARMLRFK